MKKMISLFAFMFLLPAIARADSCSTLPDCESMGYFLGYNAACGTDDSRYIFCPYDTDYRKCVDYDCEGMGFTQTDKTEWCKTIVNCLYDSAYTLCDEPKDEQCEVVTCPPAVSASSLIANAILTDPCTPMNADCEEGETVYTNWRCKNGYSYIGNRCRRLGSCDEGTYGTLNVCHSHCSGTCVEMESTDPQYSDVCKYKCEGTVIEGCPLGSYDSLDDCEGYYNTCEENAGCYYGVGCANGTYDNEEDCESAYGEGKCSESDGCYYYSGSGGGSGGNNKCSRTYDLMCEQFLATHSTTPGHALYTPGHTAPCVAINANNAVAMCTQCLPDGSDGETYYACYCSPSQYFDEERGVCVDVCAVKTCDGVEIPENARGIYPCTPIASDCSKGQRVYTGWRCNDGYEDDGHGGCCLSACPEPENSEWTLQANRCVPGHCLMNVVEYCGGHCFYYKGLGEDSPECPQCDPSLYM